MPVQTLECWQELVITGGPPAGPGGAPAEEGKLESGLLEAVTQSSSPKM